MLPVEPKLGKMLILGAIFNCLDPVLTIVSGLSVRDPFLTPFDKKDVSKLFITYLSIHLCFLVGLETNNQLIFILHSVFVFTGRSPSGNICRSTSKYTDASLDMYKCMMLYAHIQIQIFICRDT